MVDQRIPMEAMTGGAPTEPLPPEGLPGEGGGDEEGMLQLVQALMQIPFFRNLIMQQMQAGQGGGPPMPPEIGPGGPPPPGQGPFGAMRARLEGR